LYIEDKAILIKTDANGNVQWQQKYFGSGYRIANSVTQTNNGGYAFVGYVLYNFSNVHQLAVCTDSAGNKLWAKTYEATALTDGYSIHETTDGGYIFAGGCAYANSSVNVIKTNANGNSACSTATNVTNASALFLAVVNDTLYEASPPTVQTATLIQTGSGLSVTDPCLPTQVTEIAEINQVNIYPNPASDHFIIDFNKQENVVALLLTDVTGKAVYQSATKNAFYINVNTAYINNGIYLLTIQTEKTTATQKIIVAK
jgi:hypothetical protein